MKTVVTINQDPTMQTVNTFGPQDKPLGMPKMGRKIRKIATGAGDLLRGASGKPPLAPESHNVGKLVGKVFKKKPKTTVNY